MKKRRQCYSITLIIKEIALPPASPIDYWISIYEIRNTKTAADYADKHKIDPEQLHRIAKYLLPNNIDRAFPLYQRLIIFYPGLTNNDAYAKAISILKELKKDLPDHTGWHRSYQAIIAQLKDNL